jgi:hypothetical protein
MPWLAREGAAWGTLLFALGFLWLSVAIGRRLLLLLGASREGTQWERGVVGAALGAAVLEYLPFALGALGVLSVRSLRAAVLVIALASAKDMWAVAAAIAKRRDFATPPRGLVALGVALLPALFVTGLLALSPTVDPDGLAYHLTVPKRWLQSGKLEYLPTYPYSNAPMGMEMLFALAMAFVGDSAAKCIHYMFGILGVIAIYLAGKRLRGPMVAAAAAALFLVGPLGVAIVLGRAYVEGGAAFAMIAAAMAWLLWFHSREQSWLRCAALLAGFAVTFKITAALLPAALVALTWVVAADPERTAGHAVRRGLDAAAFSARVVPLMVAPMLPWMVRSALVTGNPVFPLFARWIPSRDFSPDLSIQFDRWNRYMTWGNVVGRNWSLETRHQVLLGVCVVTLMLGLFAAARMRSWMARGTAAVVVVVSLAQLSAAGLYVRYSIPLGAVVALPVAAAVESLLSHRHAPAVGWALAVAASTVQANRCLRQDGANVVELVRTAAGLEPRHAYLLSHIGLYPLFERANRDLPEHTGVMLSCSCIGFYVDRSTYCAEMVQDSLRFTGWDEFVSDVRRLGVTHVIAPSVLATGGPLPLTDAFSSASVSAITHDSQVRLVQRLLEDHSRAVATASDHGLYEIDGSIYGLR